MSRRASTALPVIALLAALIALLAYGVTSRQPDRAVDEALADGERQPAPSLTLPRLGGGGGGSLRDYRGATPAATSRRCSRAGTGGSRRVAGPSSASTRWTYCPTPRRSSGKPASPTRCSATATAARSRSSVSLATRRRSCLTAVDGSRPSGAGRWTTSS